MSETDSNAIEAPSPTGIRRWLWPSRAVRRRWLLIEGWVLVVGTCIAFLAAWLWPHDLRDDGRMAARAALIAFMVRTFRFHIGVALAVVALGALGLRGRRLAIAAAAVALFGLGPSLWSYVPKSRPVAAGPAFTVMSVNLLAVNRQTKPTVDEIVAADPDVVVLQEYAPHWHRAIAAALADAYPNQCCSIRTDSFGVAMFSKLPFVEPVRSDVRIGTVGTPQIRAVLDVGGRPVVLYDVHLVPPTGSRHAVEQSMGVADLLGALCGESGPLVVCGDFNFTNDTDYAGLVRGLGFRDAFDLAGWGRGATWPNRGLLRFAPGIRIDHIFLSPELTCTAAAVGSGGGSDHCPVRATIAFVE